MCAVAGRGEKEEANNRVEACCLRTAAETEASAMAAGVAAPGRPALVMTALRTPAILMPTSRQGDAAAEPGRDDGLKYWVAASTTQPRWPPVPGRPLL